MKCRVCGSAMKNVITDLPFKVSESTIAIVKELPVLQCENCAEYEFDDSIMRRVEEILGNVDTSDELEVIKFAA